MTRQCNIGSTGRSDAPRAVVWFVALLLCGCQSAREAARPTMPPLPPSVAQFALPGEVATVVPPPRQTFTLSWTAQDEAGQPVKLPDSRVAFDVEYTRQWPARGWSLYTTVDAPPVLVPATWPQAFWRVGLHEVGP